MELDMCSLRKNEIFKRGQVKICIPLMGKTKDEIVSNLIEIINYPVDIIEWRADHYENALDGAKSIDIINTIKEIEKNIPILYTFRTSNEGRRRTGDGEHRLQDPRGRVPAAPIRYPHPGDDRIRPGLQLPLHHQ